MVLKNYIRIIILSVTFISLSCLFSCEELMIINCSECSINEPTEVYIEINLENTASAIVITVYAGKLEENIVLSQRVTFNQNAYEKVPLNREITVTAEYKIDGNTCIAVNSVSPHVVYEENQCSDPCYYVFDRKVDLRLKNVIR